MTEPNKSSLKQKPLSTTRRKRRGLVFLAKLIAFTTALATLLGSFSTIATFFNDRFQSPTNDIELITSSAIEPIDWAQMPEWEQDRQDLQYWVEYDSNETDEQLTITYTSEYQADQTKTVGILGAGPYFALPEIGIDFKVVNNSKKTIFFSDITLSVSSSRLDKRPLIVFSHSPSATAEIEFTNDGWGEPTSIKVLSKLKTPTGYSPIEELPYRIVDNGKYRFDVSPLVRLYGVPTDVMKQAVMLDNADNFQEAEVLWQQVQPPCVRNLMGVKTWQNSGRNPYQDKLDITDQDLAAFPVNCEVPFDGTIYYTWFDDVSGEQQFEQSFSDTVFVTPAQGLGTTGFEATGSYNVELQTEGENYEIVVPISQPVEAGKVDRFILWLGAEKSSQHDFSLRLKFNNKAEINSSKIHLDYLMPKANRAELDYAAEQRLSFE